MAGTTFEQRTLTDWPTLLAIAIFWSMLIGTVLLADHIQTVVAIAILGVLGGFYMSLQHEVIHGHPTRWRWMNWSMVGIPLGLVLPFTRYYDAHVAHHNSDLTNPVDDPESFYVLASTWDHAGPTYRRFLTANRTLAGRLTMGPFVTAFRGIPGDLRLARHDPAVRLAWLTHIVAASFVITALYESPLQIWVFLVGFVYIGSMLTSLRSFAEHRVLVGGVADAPRSAVVRSGWFFSLLFLNNNLHYTHHQLPGAAWFRLPELTKVLDSANVVADSAGTYAGYGEVARRFMFRPFEQPVHPLSDSITA
ncbi:MAG: fatty acid desaturase [Ilumatobacteraceae bacterium]